jgi:hypothetical protein
VVFIQGRCVVLSDEVCANEHHAHRTARVHTATSLPGRVLHDEGFFMVPLERDTKSIL